MKNLEYLILFLLLSIQSCFKDPASPPDTENAGSGSESVIGSALYPNGTPVADASVKVRVVTFLKNPIDTSEIVDTTLYYDTYTDENGIYSIDSLTPGDYVIEINDGQSNATVVTINIDSQSNNQELEPQVLKTTGIIYGSVNPVNTTGLNETYVSSYVQVLGIDRVSLIDSLGNFSLNDIPEGRYTIQIQSFIPFHQWAEVSGILLTPGDSINVGLVQLNRKNNATSVVPNGLIAYWPFDEGTGLIAGDAVGINDGILRDNPAWSQGVQGTCIEMDGNKDHIIVPTMYLNSDFTISFWVYFTNTIHNQDAVIGTDYPGNNINFWEGKPRLFLGRDSSRKEHPDVVASDTALAQMLWHHVAVTRSGNKIIMYVNNNIDTTGQPYSGQTPASSYSYETILIDQMGKGETGTFEGKLDEMRIYNRALSSFEILELYIKKN